MLLLNPVRVAGAQVHSAGCCLFDCGVNEPQKVAIFGGAVANGKLTNYMRVLDMSAGRLTADVALKGERPAARMGHAVASIGCNVVVWGGWGHSHLLDDCYQVVECTTFQMQFVDWCAGRHVGPKVYPPRPRSPNRNQHTAKQSMAAACRSKG